MIKGIHTHFCSLIGSDKVKTVYDLGYRIARIDAQGCYPELVNEMIVEVLEAKLIPYVILNSADQIKNLISPTKIEYKNEPDGRVSSKDYRTLLDEAFIIAQDYGHELYALCISNLDENSIKWANEVKGKGFPPGLKFSCHRYGDGSFEKPHKGFDNRANEVKWFRACIGYENSWAVTEFGYPSYENVTEDRAAENIKKEWKFWDRSSEWVNPEFVIQYQLMDGLDRKNRLDNYGIMRVDGSLKKTAYTL